MWWPGSTTPGGPRSTSAWASPPWPPCRGPSTRSAGVSSPARLESEWSDPTGTLSLVERELPERWAGKRLADLPVPGEVTVVAVTRAGVARLDFGDLVGQDGDVLHLMVSDTALERLNARLVGIGGQRRR